MRNFLTFIVAAGWLFLVAMPGEADDSIVATPIVVATVAGKPIYAGEIHGEITQLLKNRKLAKADRTRLEAVMLEQVINRRLVLAYLEEKKLAISEQHVDAAIKKLEADFKQNNLTLAGQLKKQAITLEALKSQLVWRMSWKRYLERRLTDKVLEQYFNKHRQDYDGTQVRVSQIRFDRGKGDDAEVSAPLVRRAAALRKEISSGKMTFAAAARQHSQAPSKVGGGDLGLIARRGAMPEAFAAASFALKVGEISQPVVTSTGVHLILCTEIKSGSVPWTESRKLLRSALIRQSFDHIVQRQRGRIKIQRTGKLSD